MTEIEKVKKGLSLCLSGVVSVCIACPYDAECKEAMGTDQSPLLRDALKLLKEQEKRNKPVTPVQEIGLSYGPNFRCRNCNALIVFQKQKYCYECGQAVKWE